MQGDKPYEVGHKKPPVHAQFKPGVTGNPGGKSSEQKRLEMLNAEAAMRIRDRVLRAVEAKLIECSTDEAIELVVEAAMLKLLKDSEDRGLGAPAQSIEHGGALAVSAVQYAVIDPKADDSST
jgi:hypothetical protein